MTPLLECTLRTSPAHFCGPAGLGSAQGLFWHPPNWRSRWLLVVLWKEAAASYFQNVETEDLLL